MDIAEPIIQWGFAGLSIVLLGILVWLAKTFIEVSKGFHQQTIDLTEKTTDVVRDNSEAIREMKAVEDRQVAVIEKLHEELLKRPCLAKDKA